MVEIPLDFILVIMVVAAFAGWAKGNDMSNRRSPAQRRAMREDCRSKGL